MFRWIYLARKFWAGLTGGVSSTIGQVAISRNVEILPATPTEIGNQEGPGRPTTIHDNFLIGSRNAWVTLLEQAWPELGWPLICIKENPSATVKDIRAAFAAVHQIPSGRIAQSFDPEDLQESNPAQVRDSRESLEQMNRAIYELTQKIESDQFRCWEAVGAIGRDGSGDKDVIETVIAERYGALIHQYKDLLARERDRNSYEETLRSQEAFVYQSQLLDLLHSKRCAIEPRKIANGLAGLPTMVWRHSAARCSESTYDSDPHFSYQVFETVTEICAMRSVEHSKSRVGAFRSAILALGEKCPARSFLCRHWHDLEIAIVECSPLNPSDPKLPFAITSTFLKRVSLPKEFQAHLEAENEQILD